MEVIERIVASLSRYASVSPAGEPGNFFIDTLDGERLDPPARLVASPDAVAAYVEDAGRSANGVFPQVSAEEGGIRLLLIHLEEEFSTKVGPGTLLTIEPTELVITDPVTQEGFDGDPDGEYYWTADKPDQFDD